MLRAWRDTDRYVAVSWESAFEEIGAELRAIRAEDPRKAVFYASGRASLENSFRAYNASLLSEWRATKNETIRTIS